MSVWDPTYCDEGDCRDEESSGIGDSGGEDGSGEPPDGGDGSAEPPDYGDGSAEPPDYGDGSAEPPDYDDSRQPEPPDPGYDDPPPQDPPPPDDQPELGSWYEDQIERARIAARAALLEAVTAINSTLDARGRAIFYRWFPGASDADLAKVRDALRGAYHALGTADLRFVDGLMINEMEARGAADADQLRYYFDREDLAVTIWNERTGEPARDPSEHYVAVFPVSFRSDTLAWLPSTIAHEGVHLYDPEHILDTSADGQVNNSWAISGFLSELVGIPYPREHAERAAGIRP